MSLLYNLIANQYTFVGRGRFLKTMEHSSLVYDTERDVFWWNSKEIVGDVYVWLTKILGYSTRDARDFIRLNSGSSELKIYTKVTNQKGEVTTVYPKLVQLLWENGKKHREYWYRRGITDITCDRFLLGYYEGWYTIPFFVENAFVNFQKRRDEPDKLIKSWYRGLSPILFNSSVLSIAKVVVITESPTDAILLSQFGYPAVSHNGGATFWNQDWNKYFVDQKEIFIVYDNDEPGEKGARGVAEALGLYRTKIYTFHGYVDKYDLGDWLQEYNPQDFGALLDEKARRAFE